MVERAVDDLDAALEGDGVVHRRVDVEGQRRRHLIKTERPHRRWRRSCLSYVQH